jgi:polyhydroxyalkanoate synthesis repressor PhaR
MNTAPEALPPAMRVLRRNGSRRIYDPIVSKYIKYTDLQVYLKVKIPFQIIDARSGADVTSDVLLGVLREKELSGPRLLSVEKLSLLILFGTTTKRVYEDHD